MDKQRKSKMIELILMLIGGLLVTVFLSVTLGIPMYAMGVIVLILLFITGSGVWRWKQGDKQVKNSNVKSSVEKIIVTTDDFHTSMVDKANWICLGSVYGESIVATHMINDFWSSTKILIGGEPSGYYKMMNLSRRVAVNRMKIEARKKKATIITGHRLATANILSTSAEVMSYGTAWKKGGAKHDVSKMSQRYG